MTADHSFATTADTLLGPDQRTGRHLMRTALRLLARGTPVTLTELAAAAGVERMSRLAWIFGDDPLWILSGGTDSFGTFGGVGVGVSV
jgi:hypothetical protein